jgi:hypothetical protein
MLVRYHFEEPAMSKIAIINKKADENKSKLTTAEMHAYYIAIVTTPRLVFRLPM